MATAVLHVTSLPASGESVVYDLSSRSIVHEITDYTIYLRRIGLRNSLTVRSAASKLARFWGFLLARDKCLDDVSDALLAKYRDQELRETCADPSHRGSERSAKATVNQRLGTVLGWLLWLQANGRLPAKTIGRMGCRVSARPAGVGASSDEAVPGQRLTSLLYFPDAGTSGQRPSIRSEIYDGAIEAIMLSEADDYIAQRNVLAMDIARNAGFRIGSICSLHTGLFRREVLLAWKEPAYEVRPPKQKRGYTKEYSVPLDLALRISDFIEGPRKELVNGLGVGERVTRGAIFLSATKGTPITERALSQAIRPAMRAAGAPKGKVVHAVRGLFASETFRSEALARREAGLDTSFEAIAQAGAWKLGQKNHESLFPYVSEELSKIAHEERTRRHKDPCG